MTHLVFSTNNQSVKIAVNIFMIIFLAIQSTYHAVECGLFHDAILIDTVCIDKIIASSMLITTINRMLTDHGHSLDTLNFIAVNTGPAPFTTLRVVIATVNGIQFVSTLPLVGVNGFDAFLHEWDDPTTNTAIILNAFNNDVYVALKKAGHREYVSGYGKIEAVASFLARETVGPLRFLGNGVALYQNVFQHFLDDRMMVPIDCPQISSLYHVGLVGLERWAQGGASQEPLMPLYLKESTETLHISMQ